MTVVPAPALPDWLAPALPYRRVMVPTSEGRVHAIDDGEGPAVLLMHGNPTWSFLWRKVIAALRTTPEGAKLRVIAPDLLGLGLSDKPRRASDHTIPRHVRAIDEALLALGVTDVLLAAQDWGGPIGVGAMKALAERGGRVRGMLLSNTAVLPVARPLRSTPFHRFARMPILSDLAFRAALFPIPVLSRVQGDPRSIGRVERRAYRWPLRHLRDRAAPLGLARMVPGTLDHPSVPHVDAIGAFAKSFAGPIGLVWGMRDPILGRALSRHRRELTPVFVEETRAGHFLQEEVPDALARALVRLDAMR
jgi:haloalkane dehalogenase